ncbi:hypothetical protein Gotur_007643, partial [Gossypium turneri]
PLHPDSVAPSNTPFGSPFTDSEVLLFLAYSLSSCNRYSEVLVCNSYSPFSSLILRPK